MNAHSGTEDPLVSLSKFGGYYECPKDALGKRLGPLVGYAGKDDRGRQYVGDVYVNYAVAERNHSLNQSFAERIRDLKPSIPEYTEWWDGIDAFCGAPMGGLALAQQLTVLHHRAHYIYPEKEITQLASETQREQSRLVFKRHTVSPRERLAIVEDVLNNFSTTDDLIKEIVDAGGTVTAIVGFLNRSLKVGETYHSEVLNKDIPVITLVRKPFDQFKQDDLFVSDDIAAGNVVWKPKHNWDRLKSAMLAHSSVQ